MKAIYLGDSGSQLQKMKHSLHKFFTRVYTCINLKNIGRYSTCNLSNESFL